MRQERIQNPRSIERAAIEEKLAAGNRVILQFDGPHYTPGLLKKINNLCGESGKNLEVRFYSHVSSQFDASILHFLPHVESLWLDGLREVRNLSALASLENLRRLSLGIYKLDDPNILESLQLQNLEQLILCETAKANIDLAAVGLCKDLEQIYLVGHTRNIECLADLPELRMLSLGQIPKKQTLGFVSKIRSLRRLVVILGGREGISEIYHDSLEELEILRVLGFRNIDSVENFPSLRSLVIEDQVRLENIRFTPSNRNLHSLRIFNCKNLQGLNGLAQLGQLQSIRIGMTRIAIDSILEQPLAASLKVFSFHTGREKENAAVRSKLDARGYRE
jgi:protein phosphatase 1 regulatory subunit 7